MNWYAVKVQSNREKSTKSLLLRRIAQENLSHLFGDILIPVEKSVDVKSQSGRLIEQKLYPGYLLVQMVLNDDTWAVVKDTAGVADFAGVQGKPTSIKDSEISHIIQSAASFSSNIKEYPPAFNSGDTIKIKDGAFSGFQGIVDKCDVGTGKISVLVEIFGRPTPIELDRWQIE